MLRHHLQTIRQRQQQISKNKVKRETKTANKKKNKNWNIWYNMTLLRWWRMATTATTAESTIVTDDAPVYIYISFPISYFRVCCLRLFLFAADRRSYLSVEYAHANQGRGSRTRSLYCTSNFCRVRFSLYVTLQNSFCYFLFPEIGRWRPTSSFSRGGVSVQHQQRNGCMSECALLSR